MHDDMTPLRHDHVFGQDIPRSGERRTRWVIALTATAMTVEIAAGMAFGSMALLADGMHMASHVAALGINVLAYQYARRHARDNGFSFGTGKVNALGGFTGALLLAVFALFMAWESIERMLSPVAISYDQAILVAVAGLVVNAVSVMLLGGGHDHDHDGDDHDHAAHGHGAGRHHDHNLRSAYLHVLADALTSVLAIVALVAGKYAGLAWLDPAMGVVGAILVARWSAGLLRVTARVLLDRQAPAALCEAVARAIESGGADRVADLHVWSIGPGIHAAIIAVASSAPVPPGAYRKRLPPGLGLVHVTVEVHAQTPGDSL